MVRSACQCRQAACFCGGPPAHGTAKSECTKRRAGDLSARKGRKLPMLSYRFDTQLLIEGENLSEDDIHDYIQKNIEGDCLLAVGDENLIKIHFHTNTPWKVLEYCASLGDIHDIVVENMERQSGGLHG